MKIFQDPTKEFTIVANDLFDTLMPILPSASFKIVCLIYRKTKGWHKDIDQISFSQIMIGTGIKSSATIAKHLKLLEDRSIIYREKGQETWEANSYSLNPEYDTSTLKNEVEPTLKNEVEPTLKNEVEPTLKNEDTKEKEIKDKYMYNSFSQTDKNNLNRLAYFFRDQAHLYDITTTDDLKQAVIFGYYLSKEICPLDIMVAGDNRLKELARVALFVWSKANPEDQIKQFKDWWYTEYWIGKKGQAPTPAQIGNVWGQFEVSQKMSSSQDISAPKLTSDQLAALKQMQEKEQLEMESIQSNKKPKIK